MHGTLQVMGGRLLSERERGVSRGEDGPPARWLFRGTSLGTPENVAPQRLRITPATTDPLVATIFALAAQHHGHGLIYIAGREDLAGIATAPGNVLQSLELEIAVLVEPAVFARRASFAVDVVLARTLLRNAGFDVPTIVVGPAEVDAALRSTARLTPEEITAFVLAAQSLSRVAP